jgi:hypothetical protein
LSHRVAVRAAAITNRRKSICAWRGDADTAFIGSRSAIRNEQPKEPAMTTNRTVRSVAIALSAAISIGIFAGVDHLAARQYAAADALAMAQYGQQHVAVQHVVVVGRRAA